MVLFIDRIMRYIMDFSDLMTIILFSQ